MRLVAQNGAGPRGVVLERAEAVIFARQAAWHFAATPEGNP